MMSKIITKELPRRGSYVIIRKDISLWWTSDHTNEYPYCGSEDAIELKLATMGWQRASNTYRGSKNWLDIYWFRIKKL